MMQTLIPLATLGFIASIVLLLCNGASVLLRQVQVNIPAGTIGFGGLSFLCFAVAVCSPVAVGDVSNLGLLHDRLNLVIVGSALMVCSVLVYCTSILAQKVSPRSRGDQPLAA